MVFDALVALHPVVELTTADFRLGHHLVVVGGEAARLGEGPVLAGIDRIHPSDIVALARLGAVSVDDGDRARLTVYVEGDAAGRLKKSRNRAKRITPALLAEACSVDLAKQTEDVALALVHSPTFTSRPAASATLATFPTYNQP